MSVFATNVNLIFRNQPPLRRKVKPTFELMLEEQLIAEIQKLKTRISGLEELEAFIGNTILIDTVTQQYIFLTEIQTNKRISKQLSEHEELVIKEYKLAIMKALQTHLKNYSTLNENNLNENQDPYWLVVSKKFLFVFFFFSGLILCALGAFASGKTLLSFIPGITASTLKAGAGVISFIQSVFYCAFDVKIVKDMLGMEIIEKPQRTFLAYDIQALKLVENNNEMLKSATNNMQDQHYQKCASLIILMNKDFKTIKKTYEKNYQESWLSLGLKWLFNLYGVTMLVASGLYSGNAVLTCISAGLIGTPLGWLIIGIAIANSLACYIGMQKGMFSLYNLFNPTAEKYEQLQEKLKNFVPQHFNFQVELDKRAEVNLLRVELARMNIQARNEVSPPPLQVKDDLALNTRNSAGLFRVTPLEEQSIKVANPKPARRMSFG